MNLIKKFFQEQDGQDGVEYALLIGFVSSLIVAGASSFTAAFDGFWTGAAGGLGKAATKAGM